MLRFILRHDQSVRFCCVSFLLVILVFGQFVFGNRYFIFTDIGGDTYNQYFPYIVDTANDIRSGTFSFWNFNFGYGVDLASVQSWVMDPFFWLSVISALLFGNGAILHSVLFAHILKVLICIAAFNGYLKRFDISYETRLVFANLYGFSGFIMLWGQHYFFGTTFTYFTLMLLLIETYYSSKSLRAKALLIAMSFVICVFSIYSAYMIIAFAVIYILLRSAYAPISFELMSYLKEVASLLVCLLLGIVLSGIVLIPVALFLLTETNRIVSEVPLASRILNSLVSFREGAEWVMLTRFISNNLVFDPITHHADFNTNYYEAPQLMTSVAFFILIPQFYAWVYQSKLQSHQVGILILSTLLIVFYFISDFPTYALYAFAKIVWRTSFLLIPILTLACSIAWDKTVVVRKANVPLLILGGTVSIFVIGCAIPLEVNKTSEVRTTALICLCAFEAIVTMLILWAQDRNALKHSKTIMRCALALILLISIFDARYTNVHRSTWNEDLLSIDKSGVFDQARGNTAKALSVLVNDASLFRVEKTKTDLSAFNDAQYQNYAGVSNYNSTTIPKMQKLVSNIWPGIIYRRNEVREIYGQDPNQPIQATLFGIKYLISQEELDFNWIDLVYESQGAYVYQNKYACSIANEFYQAIPESIAEDMDSETLVPLLDKYIILPDEDLDDADLEDRTIAPQDSQAISFDNEGDLFYLITDAHIVGTCNLEHDGYVLLGIPAKKGWSITVDGNPTETLTGDFGLLAFKATTGKHDIELRYSIPGLEEGACVSIAGALGTVAFLLLQMKRQRRREIRT